MKDKMHPLEIIATRCDECGSDIYVWLDDAVLMRDADLVPLCENCPANV